MARTMTIEAKERIKQLAMIGLNDVQIASRLAISVKHLRRYAQAELQEGRGAGDEALASTALQMATSGLFPQMTKYLCQVRLGWYEVSGLIVKSAGDEAARGERLASVIDERLARLNESNSAKQAKLVQPERVTDGA